MKAILLKHKSTKKFEKANLLIADQKLFDYEIIKRWHYGPDCKKSGSAISVMLRKKIRLRRKIKG